MSSLVNIVSVLSQLLQIIFVFSFYLNTVYMYNHMYSYIDAACMFAWNCILVYLQIYLLADVHTRAYECVYLRARFVVPTCPVAFDFSRTIESCQLQQSIHCGSSVQGVTLLNNELFVVTAAHSQQVNVYESRLNKFKLTSHIRVPNMKNPLSLASSDRHQCLYISDNAQPYFIHRIDVRDSSCSWWSVSEEPYGLSVTRDSSVLVTLWIDQKI